MNAGSDAGRALVARAAWWAEGSLLAPMFRFASAVLITVGPWIVSVAALAVVSMTMTPLMGNAAVEDLRLSLVYAFAIAPLVAGPIGTIAGRLVRSSIEEREGRFVLEIFRVAAIGSGVLSMVAATLVSLALGLEHLNAVIGFVWMSASAALLWTTFSILAALGFYRFLLISFSSGMLLALVCTVIAARIGPTTEILVWSFTAGMAFCVIFGLTTVSARYSNDRDEPGTAFWLILGELGRAWPLALGVFAAIAAVWADKIVFWFGPDGLRSEAGFAHCGLYDAVMFVAHLSVIPSLAGMLLFQDGPLRDSAAAFRAGLARRSTYEAVRAEAVSLAQSTWGHVFSIVFIQASCSAALILMAPIVTGLMNFTLIQFDLLRIGVIAVFLQSLLFLSSSILVACQCIRTYCLIQVSFFALNLIVGTLLQGWLGVNGYAVFISSMAAAAASSVCAYRALVDYDYLFFVGANDSLYQRTDSEPTSGEETFWDRAKGRMAAARAEWTALACTDES